MVVAQAQKIEIAGDRVTFTFSADAAHALRHARPAPAWLEALAQQLAGRRIAVVGVQGEAAAPAPSQAASAIETP